MSTLRDIKVLHLEPTDVCQAACPMCARETDKDFNKTRQRHLTIEQIVKHFDEEKIKALDKMFMCGNYGDPAAGKHTLDIYNYFRQLNPNIVLGMNTNGGIRNTEWWKELATILSHPRDYVVFSIDGLEDTNHIYRRNVKWDRLMENAQAFIDAGGRAEWDYLIFKHNEHQILDALKLSRELGFVDFKFVKKPVVPLTTFDWKQKQLPCNQ